MNRILAWIIRRLVPKCDFCGKPAYFEHYRSNGVTYTCEPCVKAGVHGWTYVCWDCSAKHDGHGPIWE